MNIIIFQTTPDLFYDYSLSRGERKSRSNYLSRPQRIVPGWGLNRAGKGGRGRKRGKERAYILFLRAARGRAAWWRPICDAGNSTPPEISSTFGGLFPIYVCARGGRCTCSPDAGRTYLPCTIARLHIGRDAQHVITRAESKKTSASRPANRRSRANESEPARPMAGPTYTAPACVARCNPRSYVAEPSQGCGALRSGTRAPHDIGVERGIIGEVLRRDFSTDNVSCVNLSKLLMP